MWIGRAAVLLFLFAMPGAPSPLFDSGGHDLSRIAQVAVSLVCALALWVGTIIDRRGALCDGRVVLGAVGLTLLAIASTLNAPVWTAAMRELAMLLGLACMAAVIAACRETRQLETLVVTVVAAASLYSVLILLSMGFVMANGRALESAMVIPGYFSYRHFNHAQTVVLPLLVIACGRATPSGQSSRLVWFALAINVALLIFTRGRGTMVALVGASLLSLLLFRRAALPYARQLVAGTVIGGLVYLGLFVGLPLLTGAAAESAGRLGEAASVHTRFVLWQLALDHIAQAPWLGIGPMHYSHYPNTEIDAAHPHNVYLQLAAEWGVPFMIGLVSLATWAVWRLARVVKACAHPEQATMGVGLFTAMIAIAIDGMFSGNFVMPVSQVWIAAAIGWAVAWTRLNRAPVVAHKATLNLPWSWGAGLATIVLASQVWLCWSIAPEVLNLPAHLDHVLRLFPTIGLAAPRFWSNGWF